MFSTSHPHSRRKRLPLLIVQLGRPPEDLVRQVGEQADWFASALPDEALLVARPHLDEPLPAADRFRGVVLSGSWDMVTDRQTWSERTGDWLREIVPAGKPVLGVCYGHQLMADALGGQVDDHPDGLELGTHHVERLQAVDDDPVLGGLPPGFYAHLSHSQSVLRPPEGAVTLARSAHDAHQILRYGRRAWSLQFHPEFTADLLRRCIVRRREALAEAGHDAQTMLARLRDTPEAHGILRRFAALP
ncbi:glutamine amidotransferase [Bordetella avium]|uniref:glutamine amidotransferase n=1 Tax=Bordetella avium TaxID=521 RepID=UPI000E67B7C6|nr:glutamine amidotransferase [Bordetella avium]AZY49161.1 GMP synthase [Bordetella avium]AZY52518.1 GMP synthase [Bordetella avium]RIQ72868.1 glutamine amidotransferase [Bordetella avium]